MRKTMSEKTRLIHLLENTWENTKEGTIINTVEEREVVNAIFDTLYILEVMDNVKHENHKMYFVKRYLSHRNNMSQLQMAMKYHICRDSVSDYCKMYLKIFLECLKKAKENTNRNRAYKTQKGAKAEKTTDFVL